MSMARETQTALLRSWRTPGAILTLAIFDKDGRAVARKDDRPLAGIGDSFAFQTTQSSNSPYFDVLSSASNGHPVFQIAEPIPGPEGQFAGLVLLESNQVTKSLATAPIDQNAKVYLVDRIGRAITPGGGSPSPEQSSTSSSPLVRQILSGDHVIQRVDNAGRLVTNVLSGSGSSGALAYTQDREEWLAGYALIPSLDWHVVVELPSATPASASRWRTKTTFWRRSGRWAHRPP